MTTRHGLRWLTLFAAGLLGGCGAEAPVLPGPAGRANAPESLTVVPPTVPGLSTEFEQMEVPPGQLTRALPTGDAWPAAAAPAYRSLCLQCHSVSQTSFAVTDWRESLHARAGISCSACHGSHEVSFVPRPGSDRCVMCHPQQVEELQVSAHGPERAPGMRCGSCHGSHATDRGLASSPALCTGCHLDSDHVQEYGVSRMGLVLAEHPVGADGEVRAPDCVTCHQPESGIVQETGDFRNDRVTLHDPAGTVARHPRDDRVLADETIERLVPVCVSCHSERNARHRLENSDPLIRSWAPLGMASEIRRRPSSAPRPEVEP